MLSETYYKGSMDDLTILTERYQMRPEEIAFLVGCSGRTVENWLTKRTKPYHFFERELKRIREQKELEGKNS